MKTLVLVLMMVFGLNNLAHADLYARLTNNGESGNKIPVHAFTAALRELARGAVTRAQLVSAFSLDTEDQTDLDAIIATYQGLANDAAKKAYIVKIHDVFLLVESGFYNEAKAKTELGF